MAVADKTGRMHHSAGRAALQDEMNERKAGGGYGGAKAGAGAAKKDGAEKAGDGETNVSHMEIGEVVKKHGPAHHMVISHDDENAMHTVTSHHGKPAHVHHSEHGSREAAMDHAHEAAGMESKDEEEANETPGQEMDESEENENEQPSSKIPGMAEA